MQPRERYTVEGPTHFSDDELLALILGTGTAEHSAIDIARGLLERFQGLGGLAEAPPGALVAVPGVGQARAVRVHAACAIARRAQRTAPPSALRTPADAWRFLRPRVAGLAHEELHAIYLGRGQRVLAWRRLTAGNATFTIVDPKQVLRPAVALGAGALLLAHNHPSGDPEPSEDDLRCTRRVAEAGRLLDIALLDHLVLGRSWFVSLAERGVLPAWSHGPPMLTGS
jgi:DNA repair protein RadC